MQVWVRMTWVCLPAWLGAQGGPKCASAARPPCQTVGRPKD